MKKRTLPFITLLQLLFAVQGSFAQAFEDHLVTLEDKAYEHFYSNKDSTYFYFDKINELALTNNKVVTAIDNLNYVCFSAGYFYDLEKIESTIKQIDELVLKHASVLDTLADGGSFQKNCLRFNKGIYFHKLEDFNKAEFYFNETAQRIISTPNYTENIDDLDLLSQSYSFIAQMNATQKKHQIAFDYYEKNIRLFERHKPQELEELFKVYNLYANSLYKEKKYEKAKKLWQISLDHNEKNYNESNRNSIVTTSLLLSKTYRDLNKIDSAVYYLNKTNKYKVKDDPFRDRYLIAKGEINLKEGNYAQALTDFNDALQLSLENDKPRLRKKIGDLYVEKKDYKNALRSYQKGIGELSSNFNSNVYATNPDPASVKQKNTLLSLLTAKANTLGYLEDFESQKSVLNSVNTGLKTLDLLKPTFKNQTDKLSLIENAFKLFETGIETAYQLHKTKPTQKYIDTVFWYFEKSKSVLLLEALLATKATTFANIPETLLERESQLKSEINFLEKQLNKTTQTDSEKEDQLFELQKEHRELITNLETNYKDYYNLKYNTRVMELNEAQKLLEFDEKLISYFYGNDAIYAISIGKNSKCIERIPIDASLENEIKHAHRMLANSKSEISLLAKSTYKLYSKLLAPLINPKEKKKLIIIADGLLNYIPFGALNTQENEISYLVENQTIRYANSATLYAQLLDRDQMKGDLLAFAPSFSGEQIQIEPSRDKLLPLPHNKREVAQILNSFDGQSFIDYKATLQNFTATLSNHRILHLATHAVFNDVSPEYSYLAFSSTEKNENLLYVNDLYTLQVNADLVTLSACESGVGALKKGEGFLSLARGFFYSGASSIASTLWKINDASTATLMNSFYQSLSEGAAKDVALQKAQISFLQTNEQNRLKHPYYWSAFVISGNTKPIATNQYEIWISLFSVLGILGGLFAFKKMRKTI